MQTTEIFRSPSEQTQQGRDLISPLSVTLQGDPDSSLELQDSTKVTIV